MYETLNDGQKDQKQPTSAFCRSLDEDEVCTHAVRRNKIRHCAFHSPYTYSYDPASCPCQTVTKDLDIPKGYDLRELLRGVA